MVRPNKEQGLLYWVGTGSVDLHVFNCSGSYKLSA
jgi:hypothetical protein